MRLLCWLLLGACAPPPLPDTTIDTAAGSTETSGVTTSGTTGTTTTSGATSSGTTTGSTSGSTTSGSTSGTTGSGTTGGTTTPAEPEIRILFPETTKDVTICPEFIVVVDIQNFEVVDYSDQPPAREGEGHWHLYVGSTYAGASSASWREAELIQSDTGPAIIRAVLADNEHNDLDEYQATAEFLIAGTSDAKDCVGGSVPEGGPGG